MKNVAVIGAGSWATALAILLAKKGLQVSMWARDEAQVAELNQNRENRRYLPDIKFPVNLSVSADLEQVVRSAEGVVLGVPSHAVRSVAKQLKPYLGEQQIVVNTAKGLEEGSMLRMSEVLTQELPQGFGDRLVVLSGPSHAEEVARDIPTTIVVSANSKQVALLAQDLFMSSTFRVYTNRDIIGVELGGALKNVIALCCGVSDGLGFGDNTKAALMTRGLAEITRLGKLMGAEPMTFLGLAGVGDLIVTCTSMHSRNRRAGIEIGKGRTPQEAMDSVQMVVEGVRTTKVAWELARQYNVPMPITEQAFKVLFTGKDPRDAVSKLMLRGKAAEMQDEG